MSPLPPGNGKDPRVIPFRRREPEPPRRTEWRMPLKLFAILFIAGAVLTLVLQNSLAVAELLTAFLFALVVAAADFFRRRKGLGGEI
jgi:polyferredoxin